MTCDTVRLLLKQYGVGNKRAPIPALGNIAFIPQSHHEFVPQFCDGTDADPRRFGLAGEPVSGKAGHDQVEGIARVSPVLSRVGERVNDVDKFQDRTRPSVRHQQWLSITMRASDVQKVNRQTVDISHQIVKGGESSRHALPVVVIHPIAH